MESETLNDSLRFDFHKIIVLCASDYSLDSIPSENQP